MDNQFKLLIKEFSNINDNSTYFTNAKKVYTSLIDTFSFDLILKRYISSISNEEKGLLKGITIKFIEPEINLFDFCEEFYQICIDENAIKIDTNYKNIKLINKLVCEFVSNKIYKLDFRTPNNKKTIDENAKNIFERIKTLTENKGKTVCSKQELDNKIVQRLICAMVPYLIVIDTLLYGTSKENLDIFLHFYYNYILSPAKDVFLSRKEQNANHIIVSRLKETFDFFTYRIRNASDPDNINLGNRLLNQIDVLLKNTNLIFGNTNFKKSNPYFITELDVEIANKHQEAFKLFLEIITDPTFAQYDLNTSSGSFKNSVFNSIYYLYCAGKKEFSQKYILKYYETFSHPTKKSAIFFLLLILCIIHCYDYGLASALLGKYSLDYIITPIKSAEILDLSKRILTKLNDAFDSIKQLEMKNYNKLFYRTIYNNTEFHQQLSYFNNKIENNQLLTLGEFKKLEYIYDTLNIDTYDYININRLKNILNWDISTYNTIYNENHNDDKILVPSDFSLSFKKLTFSDYEIAKAKLWLLSKQLNENSSINYILQTHVFSLQENAMREQLIRIKQIKECKNTNDNPSQISEVEKEIEDVLENLLLLKNGNNKYSIYYKEILDSRNKFFSTYTNTKNTDIDSLLEQKLGVSLCNKIYNSMVQSKFVYNTLLEFKTINGDSLFEDFSAACIPLTKSLELILNEIYKRFDKSPNPNDRINSNFYIRPNTNVFKEHLELGTCAYIFRDSLHLNYRENHFEKGGEIWNHFQNWNNNSNVVNFDLLLSMSYKFYEISIPCEFYNHGTTRIFNLTFSHTDSEYNRYLISSAISYAAKNFRNLAAHKDPLSKEKMDECREFLITTQQLIWILLLIIE